MAKQSSDFACLVVVVERKTLTSRRAKTQGAYTGLFRMHRINRTSREAIYALLANPSLLRLLGILPIALFVTEIVTVALDGPLWSRVVALSALPMRVMPFLRVARSRLHNPILPGTTLAI